MRVLITGLNSLIGEEFQFSGPSMQPQRAIDRTRVRHLARRPEVNLNLLTMVGILNESPNQYLQYLRTHIDL